MISVMEKPRTHLKKRICKGKVHTKADTLEKYIISDERDLPMLHTGADISRPLNAMRLAEYHKCKDCLTLPVLYIQYKTEKGHKRQVGLCERHWGRLADTVIGWKGD
ncbi:MAG: hypothetical protein NWF09_06635 [Candidatus Bathyarchaeota archaeon]|nr:hypothetical protein [Candidatus Bathyarchaeota archaeon]